MKANIRMHLAFHIHVLVVSLCQLGIVLLYDCLRLRRCCRHRRLIAVVSVVSSPSLSPSLVTLRVVTPIRSCPFDPSKHLYRQTIDYSIPHDKDCSQKRTTTKEQLKNQYQSSPLSSLSVSVSVSVSWYKLSPQLHLHVAMRKLLSLSLVLCCGTSDTVVRRV